MCVETILDDMFPAAPQAVLIPVSIAMSVLGLCSSLQKLLGDVREQHQQSGISSHGVIGIVFPTAAAS